jgi:thiamine kinase-like enzyme
MASYGIELAVSKLLSNAGFSHESFQINPLSASGNNRVFALHCGNEKMVLKWYFYDAADTRDRLGAEYSFLEHAWTLGLRCIPKPIAKNESEHLALYEYVTGQTIDASKVNENLMQQAAHFLAKLNTKNSRATASMLPKASEACFSVSEHFSMIDARLSRLDQMPVLSKVDKEAKEFVKRLEAYWQDAKSRILIDCQCLGFNPENVLDTSERCLSPSDFGFHNALLRPDGQVCFIDFEYAGWDDPAKAIGDFFSHPGVKVPHAQFETFMAKALEPFDQSLQMIGRVRALEPISQIKWCCIILNEFLPASAKRRSFANPDENPDERKQRQLNKATQFFESLPN